MFYRLCRYINVGRFNRGIAGILKTCPLFLQDAPWCIVSMVANRDVPMYLVAIKAFYSKIGRGKVAAIIDRDMPQGLRDTLTHHVPGIEFVILEDIPTFPCQRGGTWERLLYCLDRSEHEFTIQLDADMLAVGEDLSEVMACLEQNRAFTMSDGFYIDTLDKVAEVARATPSNYVGIAAEACMDRLQDATTRRYIRGSSGFAGFAKGGYSRAEISIFHQDMEALVNWGRWREWGSEQCGSNFAIANSPNPLILPYPAFSSFTSRVLRHQVKLFHFIGRFRFVEGYYLRRASEIIATLTPGATPPPPPPPTLTTLSSSSRLVASLATKSLPTFLKWSLTGRRNAVTLQMRTRIEFRSDPGPGPRVTLRGGTSAARDAGEASTVFTRLFCLPPVWIPPERVELIVDLFGGIGMSCVWWLANYWRAQLVALEPDSALAAQLSANIALNGFEARARITEIAAGPARGAMAVLRGLEDRRIDILRVNMATGGADLLLDPAFASFNICAVTLTWHAAQDPGGRDWSMERLEAAGFTVHITAEEEQNGVIWGFRAPLESLQKNASTCSLISVNKSVSTHSC